VTVTSFQSVGHDDPDSGETNYSWKDGIYTVTVDHTKISGTSGIGSPTVDLTADAYRYFGDHSTTYTPEMASVDTADFIAFRQAFNETDVEFDWNGDGGVASNDFVQFRTRFNGFLP